ncbi:MAG: hypothetical protein N2A42_00980, partial [Luteolibacter sp.]
MMGTTTNIVGAALPALPGVSPESLSAWFVERGEPAFRAKQILDLVWKKKATSFDEMTNLP